MPINFNKVWISFLIILTSFFVNTASFADQEALDDPYESFNRAIFQFNEGVDKIILKPIAKIYNAILPKPVNQGIHNFFLNLNNFPTIANDILQADIYYLGNDFFRLIINSTVGVLGFFDVASKIKLKPHSNDFGITLAKWGYVQSNYLVLPFWGPSTIRDGIGLPIDYYGFSVYPYIEPSRTRYIIYGVSVIDRRAQLLQYQSVLEEAAIDKYIFVRNAYLQRRAHLISDSGFNPKSPSSLESEAASESIDNSVQETTTQPTKQV